MFTGTTRVGVVLDRSGSMLRVKNETINGFNTWLAETKKLSGDLRASIVLFNDTTQTVVDDQPIGEVNDLDESRYVCRGNTALNDALAETIFLISDKLQEGERALICVITDGVENHSREYSTATVRQVIKDKELEGNWTFTYLSAHPGAFRDAEALGVKIGNTMAYAATSAGTTQAFRNLARGTQTYTMAAVPQAVDFYEQDVPNEPIDEFGPEVVPVGPVIPDPQPFGYGGYGGGGYGAGAGYMRINPAGAGDFNIAVVEPAPAPRIGRRGGGNMVRRAAPPPIIREDIEAVIQRQLAEADMRPVEYDGNGIPYPENGIGTDNSLASWAQQPRPMQEGPANARLDTEP